MKIKLLQWNILFKEGIHNILRTIQELNPDIICLQEVTLNSSWNNHIDTAKFIANSIDFHYAFVSGQKFLEGNTTGSAIISRFPLSSIETGVIQETPKDYDESFLERRCYIKATITPIKNKKITLVTTHMSFSPYFEDIPEKIEENNKIINFLKKQKSPLIFTGDCNSTPKSNFIKRISEFLVHASPDFKENTWTTKPFDYKGFKEDKLNWRLDYIFASKDVKVFSSKIIKTNFSDHLPILAVLEI